MSFFLLFLILSEVLLPNLTCASRVRRQTLKVRISVIGDTVMLRFLQPDTDTKLEGYILGYGSDLFSKQFIQLPEDGEPYETEIDAEPKYLVAVQPAKGEEVKKQCIGKETLDKPLHLVIGSVTSTSVMLSWGTLLNTLTSESNLDDCLEDGHFTVRYREKEPRKKWNYQICPTTDTIIDQLKPETPYEFGVRVESDNIHGAWSPPVIHNTADEDIHNPLKPEKNLSPKNPITESPPTFFPSVPVLHIVTQSKPASLLQPPAPPPKEIVPQAKDPEKPGTFRQTKNPITAHPQAFTTSVPVLHNVTQSRPASPHKHPTPPPTQRVTQAIHKPLQPEIFLNPKMPITESPQEFSTSVPSKVNHKPQKTKNTVRPKKPITESPQAFSTSEPAVLHSITQSRPASLLKNTAPPPIPRVTLGTGSDGIRTSHPSEDSLFLAQTLTSTHAPMSNLKSTNLPQTHDSTIPSLSVTTQQSLYKTQPQLTTSKTLFSTPKTQSNTAKTVSSTVKTQPTLTQKKTIKLHKTIHPQPQSSTTKCLFSTSTFQLSSTQFQPHTAKYLLSTAQPKPRSPQPYKINPKTTIKQLQHSTIKGQLKTTQNKFTTFEPITTQSQYIRTQSQSDTTQSQYSTNQSPPHTTQPQSTGIQSEPYTTEPQSNIKQSQPHTTQPKPTATQSPLKTPQPQSTASKSRPHTTKSQTNPVKYYPPKILPVSHSNTVHSQPPPTQSQPIKFLTQPHITQPQTTTNQVQPHTSQFQTNTIKYHQRTAQHQPITTQSHTSQSQPIKTKFNPNMHTEKSQPTTRKTKLTETQTKPRRNKHRPSESHKAQPQHTTTHSSTAKYQANNSSHEQIVTNQYHKYTNKSKFTHKPNTYYQFSPTVEGNTEFQQQPDQHPTSATIKLSNANTRQNGKTGATHISPWGEKKPVNKKLPVSKMGQDVSSTLTASVASTSSTPTVTKRVSPVSIPNPLGIPPTNTNTSDKKIQARYDERLKGQLGGRSPKLNRKQPELNKFKEQANQVDKDEGDKVTDLKRVEAIPVLKSSAAPLTTEIYQKPTPTNAPFFAFNGSWYNMGDNSSIFSSVPVSEVDPMGKKRFVAPHVIYKIDKPPEKPCSVTDSLTYFHDEENMVTNISGPPKTPPTNVTVVTVEGCPSFVIVDWEKTDNETTVYEVTSSFPNGQVVSVVQTNQTHAAVENLKPESSYEFTVTPKNELGSGPSSEAVSFNTESADPRVSAAPTGKNAIWSSFSFDADSYSECTGTQYVKRTWYRKFVGIQLCNSLRYKIYLSDSLKGKFYNIGDETGYGEDHCQFVDSFLDGQTGGPIPSHHLPLKQGYFRSMRQEPVKFGRIGGSTQINYVAWYECGVPIPGSW